MGYMLSESGIANDLYRMFHVWFGGLKGGLAIGTIGLMVVISAMNGLSVAGMAIGASIALPEMLRRGYDKVMITGVVQAGSSLGILVPPSVVLALYGMIARQPVGQLWLAGAIPGLMMATLFITRWDLTPREVLIMMQLSYILMGMFLDDTAMLVIVAPLYVPLVKALGFDPIWYGVLYTITCQIAYMTPPFGYNLFLMRAMAPPEITLPDIYRSIIPFVLVMTLGLIVVIVFPQVALWLPGYVYSK